MNSFFQTVLILGLFALGFSLFATYQVNSELNETNASWVGECIQVSQWIFPAKVIEVRWATDDPAPIRLIKIILDDKAAKAKVTVAQSLADGESTSVRWPQNKLYTVSCKM